MLRNENESWFEALRVGDLLEYHDERHWVQASMPLLYLGSCHTSEVDLGGEKFLDAGTCYVFLAADFAMSISQGTAPFVYVPPDDLLMSFIPKHAIVVAHAS